jgi:hypothetical protein
MASLADSDDDAFDKQTAPFPPERSAPAYHASRPRTLTSDKDNELALALRLSLLLSDDFGEQVARLHGTESASASEGARSSTSPDECDEDDLEPAPTSSQLPADIFDEQVRGFNQQRASRTAIEDGLAPLPTAMSFAEVWATPFL